MRTHIVVPDELIQSLDKLVGPRSRSRFFVEAAEERMVKMKRAKVAKKLAGSLAHLSITGWETSKETAKWVHNSRKADERNG